LRIEQQERRQDGAQHELRHGDRTAHSYQSAGFGANLRHRILRCLGFRDRRLTVLQMGASCAVTAKVRVDRWDQTGAQPLFRR
jgi:hypothetical protein